MSEAALRKELADTKEELAKARKALQVANSHGEKDAEHRLAEYHESSMELAMGLSECFEVLQQAGHGDLSARVGEATLRSSDELIANLGKALNDTLTEISSQHVRMDEYHASSMDLAMGLSECFQVLAAVRAGDLDARVGEATLSSSDELMQNLAVSINQTIEEQATLINRQRFAIKELSTPILQVWDSVLALPVIGVVDSKRAAEIMEKLLSEIKNRQARYVILDITGVEVVDTKTADHFIKMIRAAELIGSKCLFTGISPAIAQTLVELGIDLSAISTMRDLQEGLKECLRLMRQEETVTNTAMATTTAPRGSPVSLI